MAMLGKDSDVATSQRMARATSKWPEVKDTLITEEMYLCW